MIYSREILKSSTLAMEYRAALVIIQLMLASVYSRKFFIVIFVVKTTKLKLKAFN